jgi:hypothetical protein
MDGTVWETREIEPDRIYRMQAGERSILAGYTGGEWRVASSLDRGRPDLRGWEEGGFLEDFGDGSEYDWTRIVTPVSRPVLRAIPAMPDKPLVVRPEYPIFLPSGKEGLFFVEIPMWIRITGSEGKGFSGELLLNEVAVQEMSKTWFGNLSAGELCYVYRTRAANEIPPIDAAASSEISPAPFVSTAVCPVAVKNSASSLLEFGRFCLRTEFLSIFAGDDRLWTSAVQLEYRGQEEAAQSTGSEAPKQLTGVGTLLTPPRAVPDNSIVRKSFSLLKDLTGW